MQVGAFLDAGRYTYLRHVLTHIADYPITRVAELLPWNVARQLQLLAA